MKNDQNIVHIHQGEASSLSQVRRFHAKAHCLRSRAFTSSIKQMVSFVINIPQRFADYRVYRQAYKDLYAMDNHLLRDLGLTRGDLERVKQGRAGVQAIQQDYATVRANKALPTQAHAVSDQEVTLPSAIGQ